MVEPPLAFDSLDPAIAYANGSWQLDWRVYLGLLSYESRSGVAGTVLVPALARSLPRVSDGGRRYLFQLRPGLRYSNGAPVRASDIKYAIERLFRINSPGVGFFGDIAGAAGFAKTRSGGISGIVADDRAGTIEFQLVEPRNDFANVLAMPFAAAVPAGTPPRDRSATSSIPATGPYEIASYKPNRSVTLVRNPYFHAVAWIVAGNPDRVEVQIGADAMHDLFMVRQGSADYDGDLIPVDQLSLAQRALGDHLRLSVLQNTIYVWMNTRTRPFNDIRVRRAVEYAIDRKAVVRVFGGLALPTENVLPPGYSSYRRLDLYPYDIARARALVRAAGADGAQVKVWGPAEQPFANLATYVASTLDAIGLKASIATVQPTTYDTIIGNQSTHAQIGYGGWWADYPNPIDWFDTLLNGEHITQTHNNNYANANDPRINHQIDRLRGAASLTEAVNAAWAGVDRMVMSDAFIAPVVNMLTTDAFASRIDMRCYVDQWLYGFDWTRICIH